jgi:dTDP-4-dehydrorhamnose reductase
MRILLTGPTGQVGSALAKTLPAIGEVFAADRKQLDLANPGSIRDCMHSVRPDVIFNAAAYTAVDRAEREETLAMAVNRDGPALLAEEAAKLGTLLVHYSTDYVFDGAKASPYLEGDDPRPLNAYGRSKLAGEQAIEASGCRYLTFRTSWVYSDHGHNFLLTMLRLARSGQSLRVVNDQFGAPTSHMMVAEATMQVLRTAAPRSISSGVFHMSARGRVTWFEFAVAIFTAMRIDVNVTPIASSEYKTAARRPRNSLLDNTKLGQQFGVCLPAWESGMHKILARIAHDQK